MIVTFNGEFEENQFPYMRSNDPCNLAFFFITGPIHLKKTFKMNCCLKYLQ